MDINTIFRIPVAECIWHLDQHYPNAFVFSHAKPLEGTRFNREIIVHTGEDTNNLLIIVRRTLYSAEWDAILQCVDNGGILVIERAMASERYSCLRWMYGTEVFDNVSDWLSCNVKNQLQTLFPNRQIQDNTRMYPPFTHKIYRKIKQWFFRHCDVQSKHFKLRLVKHYYRSGLVNPRIKFNYQTVNNHPWAVLHDRETLHRFHAEEYPIRYYLQGGKAATKIQHWWKRKLIPIWARYNQCVQQCLSKKQCVSKLIKSNIVTLLR
jgi:hypothetical protein